MPCVPIGMTVTSGRTSRLNRFLSMPRYDGASRSRMNRAFPTLVLTAHVQFSDSDNAVQPVFGLPSDTCAISRAGLSTAPCIACAAAFKREAHLPTGHSDGARSARRVAARQADIVRAPVEDVASQPADRAAAESLFSREAADQRKGCEHQSMAPRQPCHVMRGQELLEGGKSLIDPLRE